LHFFNLTVEMPQEAQHTLLDATLLDAAAFFEIESS